MYIYNRNKGELRDPSRMEARMYSCVCVCVCMYVCLCVHISQEQGEAKGSLAHGGTAVGKTHSEKVSALANILQNGM